LVPTAARGSRTRTGTSLRSSSAVRRSRAYGQIPLAFQKTVPRQRDSTRWQHRACLSLDALRDPQRSQGACGAESGLGEPAAVEEDLVADRPLLPGGHGCD
jgi:hypothetical protein